MRIILLFLSAVFIIGRMFFHANEKPQQSTRTNEQISMNDSLQTATFGSGCFWCAEVIFQHLRGVHSVTSGYSGGTVPNPTYKQVCEGTTGHAEVIQITYDPKEILYDEILEVFWKTHDPTTLNRQGNDVGTQYRSVIFITLKNKGDLPNSTRRNSMHRNFSMHQL